MQARFLFSEVGSGLRRNVSMAVSVVLVTMVSMFLLGLGLLAQRQADTMKGYWYDRIQVSIYLCTADSRQPNCENAAVTDAQKAAIQRQLQALPEVKEVFFESEQEAYDRFKEQFRNSPIAGNVQVGDIPQSLRVQLNDPTKYRVVSEQFEGAPGVATVQDQEKVLSKFFTIIKWITIFAVALAGLMAACAALLMATTIRQAAFCCQLQRLLVGNATSGGDADHTELPPRQGSGLVEDHGGDIAGLLQAAPVPHQEPSPCAQRGGDGNDQRHGQAKGMGAGDHQHGDQALDRERWIASDGHPRHERRRPRHDGRNSEPECRPVGQSLRPRA